MHQPMKLVTALVKPFTLDAVLEALKRVGVHGLTMTEARGCGRHTGRTEFYRGAEYTPLVPMLKLEIAIASDQVATITEAIIRGARTGESGDGMIFVSALDEVVRVSTGATDQIPPRKAA
ncbi:MAG: P-II family nitrogen regulator [Xanthobacteraceae bacterium]